MKKCLLCEKRIDEPSTFIQLIWGTEAAESDYCLPCLEAFAPLFEPVCEGCGRASSTAHTVCSDCSYWEEKGVSLLGHRALYVYNQQMKDYMAKYKFVGDYRLGRLFQRRMRSMINETVKEMGIDWIVPIPVSDKRYGGRGFNQVDPWLPKSPKIIELLQVRPDKGKDQSDKSRPDRLRSPQPFTLNTEKKHSVEGKRILLVDDVYTTGRTLYHAQARCLEAKADFVTSCSLAR